MEQSMEKATMSMMEGCAYIGISRPTLTRLMDEGQIRSFRIGRRRFCLKTSLDDFIQGKIVATEHEG
jgi:excisionase family DNA binding protein